MMVQHSWGIRPETVMPLETLAQNSRITPWVTRCCSDRHKTNPNSWGVETDTEILQEQEESSLSSLLTV